MDKNKLTTFGDAICPTWMKEMFDDIINISERIGCMETPAIFFKNLFKEYRKRQLSYNVFKPASEATPMLLKYAECRLVNIMYNKICEKFVYDNTLTPPQDLFDIDAITDNDILSIVCPTIFTGYHYIFAVVDGDIVDIYQSYGNKMLYQAHLDLEEFKQQLKNMRDIQTYPKRQALAMIKGFERRVYLNDFDKKIEDLTESDFTFDDVMDELYTTFIMNKKNDFNIKVYKFNHTDCEEKGGKRRRRYTKNHKTFKRKNNLKKTKRYRKKTK